MRASPSCLRAYVPSSSPSSLRRFVASSLLLLSCIAAAPAIDRFESTIAEYEKLDREAPPKPGGTLFVGSSTFRMWKPLEEDFRDLFPINRGFGGSTIPEVLHYMDRIVLPYKPARIVFYAGENDIASGRSPQQVADDFAAFVERCRKSLPGVRIWYLTIKTSPSRLKFAAGFDEAHRLIKAYADQQPDVGFIDIRPLMMDAQGKPRPELYLNDMLHMNRAGMELWIPVIREAVQSPVTP